MVKKIYSDEISICISKSTIEEDSIQDIYYHYQIQHLTQHKKQEFYILPLKAFESEEKILDCLEKELRHLNDTKNPLKIISLTYKENYKIVNNTQQDNPQSAQRLKNILEDKLGLDKE